MHVPPLALVLSILLGVSACTGPTRGAKASGASAPLFARAIQGEAGTNPARGTTTLLVPGAAWIDGDLAPLAAALPVVSYDLRGRGRSPVLGRGSSPTIEDDVRDLERLRERLGLERVRLLGWAYAGAVTLRYALVHPERVESLVLVSPFPAHHSEWDAYLRTFTRRADQAAFRELDELRRSGKKSRNPEEYARRVMEASLAVYLEDPERREAMRSDPVTLPNLDPDVTARIAASILQDLGEWDWTEELRALEVPVLIVHGEEGLVPLEAARRYANALPRAELLRLTEVGHMPWLEEPDAFFPAVEEFLLRVGQGHGEGIGEEIDG